jgi:hypothetical protein
MGVFCVRRRTGLAPAFFGQESRICRQKFGAAGNCYGSCSSSAGAARNRQRK